MCCRLLSVWDPCPHRVPASPLSPIPQRNPHANHTASERGQSFNATLFKLKSCGPLNTAHKFTGFSALHWGSLYIKGKWEKEEEKIKCKNLLVQQYSPGLYAEFLVHCVQTSTRVHREGCTYTFISQKPMVR